MRTTEFMEKLEHDRIVQAISLAETKTSGEIRVFVQHGPVDDPVPAARSQFEKLGMTATRERNGVLIFVAPRSQKFAVIGDQGVHEKCGDSFWHQLTLAMRTHFQAQDFTDAVVHAVREIGRLLAQQFPRRPDDHNELPDAVEEG
ncbi:MAG: TPM domain-containing protein [Spartobacteria bacterium]